MQTSERKTRTHFQPLYSRSAFNRYVPILLEGLSNLQQFLYRDITIGAHGIRPTVGEAAPFDDVVPLRWQLRLIKNDAIAHGGGGVTDC